ncbi:hypothetical protein Mal15_05320 [Stieleria maiorica]|uniref:Porin n=1 Tax=Stieleria maiorica TaxID=2795974 RepID=A0A5B9MAD1_9BACT|nr:porin [Stieleria maiorica]QEF96504.1 hypothetical protein Mal15_05320 [Stieleria maiorica]
MKLSKIAMLAAIACASYTSSMTASGNDTIDLVSHCAAACDCGEPVCGCEVVAGCDPCGDACDSGCGDAGCDSGCCDSGCGLGGGLGSLLGDCCLGEQWSLFGEHCGWSAGGWVQMGYHNNALPLFNSRPDEYQLHQAWLYAEKAIDTSCGFDIGGRIDYVYGTDGPDTQAFGTDPRGWDNDWDHGNDYGHAIPQLYMEAGYGDLSVKMGHFFTIIGWEVVTAPDNFFYSHAYTMYNSEPFTHTGVLATYNVNDNVTAYGGYTFGWDSGFDDNGDNFLGGLSVALSDDVSLTYATTIGRFGDLPLGTPERGYMHSIVADVTLTDSLQYIFQSDYLDTENAAGTTVRETFGINQYLIYTLSDCWAAGGRFEWYNQEGVYSPVGQDDDIYALTLGLNYKPHSNVIVRPEIRWDWDDAVVAGLDEGDDQTTFGIDTIFLF